MPIAFFDLDNTLLATNSGKLWVQRELALGHITRFQALRAMAWMAQYHLGFARLESAVERAIAMLEGMPEAELRGRSDTFYEQFVRKLYRPGGLDALRRHRAHGHRLVLLTSSSHYLAERVAAELSLDAVLCNRFEVDARGLHTGRSIGAVCFGEGKLRHAEVHAAQTGEPLGASWFYTDSYSDLPVLERVGHPVAVNPDRRLRRLAARRGWEIADWGTPSIESGQPALAGDG